MLPTVPPRRPRHLPPSAARRHWRWSATTRSSLPIDLLPWLRPSPPNWRRPPLMEQPLFLLVQPRPARSQARKHRLRRLPQRPPRPRLPARSLGRWPLRGTGRPNKRRSPPPTRLPATRPSGRWPNLSGCPPMQFGRCTQRRVDLHRRPPAPHPNRTSRPTGRRPSLPRSLRPASRHPPATRARRRTLRRPPRRPLRPHRRSRRLLPMPIRPWRRRCRRQVRYPTMWPT